MFPRVDRLEACPTELHNLVTKGPLPFGFLTEPERPHKRNLRSAFGRFASDRSCPEISYGLGTIRVIGVEIPKFRFSLCLDILSHSTKLISQFRSMAWNVLQHYFQDQVGHRVEVASEHFATKA